VGDTAELTTKRIKLLDVPIDKLPPEDFEERIKTFFEDEGKHQIVLLDLMGFLKARRLNDFGKCVRQASLSSQSRTSSSGAPDL
jgi:UDP-N-acetyl-D-mannosaminuronic acid transferase (WecB/TagA/CpsF family)